MRKVSKNTFKKYVISSLAFVFTISLNTPNITYAKELINENILNLDGNVNPTERVELNNNNFPDSIFLEYVKNNFDLDGDNTLSSEELLKVKSIGIKLKGITSLKGIEYFPNLTYINADYNNIETLDISNNTKLTTVLCNNNRLTSIKLPNAVENYNLVYLDIFANHLKDVDLHNLKGLKFLHIDDNQITQLDLSDNPLTDGHGFVAQNNYIEEITLPNNNQEYPWVEFLATQLFPIDKSKGYKVEWYLNKEKTEVLNQKETPIITCTGQTLYAEYVPIKYTVQFNPGLGTGEVKTQDFKYGYSQNLLKNTYTKLGYNFAGWKDSKGRIYNDEAEIINLTDVDGKVITLTATWVEKELEDTTLIITNSDLLSKVYDGQAVVEPIIEKNGSTNEPEIKWYKKVVNEWQRISEAPLNAGEYQVTISVEKDDNYNEASISKQFTIAKAIPSYIVPSDLNSNYGDTLNDIILPEGFSFQEDLFTSVGNVGENNFTLIYTPEDTLNYEIINNINVAINVNRSDNEWIVEPTIEGWTYGDVPKEPIASSKYGEIRYLYSNSENGIYGELPENPKVGRWYMKAIVEGNENYSSLEKISEFNINEKEVNTEEFVIPEINKETDLKSLEIKYKDMLLKEGIDYDVTKIQEENMVTVKISFKDNYSGEIIKTYSIEENSEIDTPLEEDKPSIDKPIDSPVEEEKPSEDKPNTDGDSNTSIPDNTGNIFRPGLDIRAGERRYDTAVELSKSKFNKADTVVIAGGYAIADGLTATPIATEYNSPLLLVEKNNIPEVTKSEIKRLGAKNVIIVGGTTVISQAVEKQLLSLGVSKITRLGGSDRYETSLLVAQYIDSYLYDIENIVVTNGLGEADALSISPVSGRDRMPIILVRSNAIPTPIYNWISGEGLKNAYIIGGKTAINDSVLNEVNKITSKDISANRIGGSTRYETNALIIDKFYGKSTNKVYVSKGLQLIDALSSGPIAALENSPVILVGNDLTATQRSILSKRSTDLVVQAGYGISTNVVELVRGLLSSK